MIKVWKFGYCSVGQTLLTQTTTSNWFGLELSA